MKIKTALLALSDAVRRARLEIACYRDPECRGTPVWPSANSFALGNPPVGSVGLSGRTEERMFALGTNNRPRATGRF